MKLPHDYPEFWPEDDPALPPPTRTQKMWVNVLVCFFGIIFVIAIARLFGG